jgi:hypothetical protein
MLRAIKLQHIHFFSTGCGVQSDRNFHQCRGAWKVIKSLVLKFPVLGCISLNTDKNHWHGIWTIFVLKWTKSMEEEIWECCLVTQRGIERATAYILSKCWNRGNALGPRNCSPPNPPSLWNFLGCLGLKFLCDTRLFKASTSPYKSF